MWSSGRGRRGLGRSTDHGEEVSTFGRDWFYSKNLSRLKFSDSFAFGARRLISHYVALWMASYADQVIISGQLSKTAVPGLLYSSGVGRHTSIVYLDKESEVSRYVWEHKTLRPNTFSYPITCPSCNCVYSWRDTPSQLIDQGLEFKMTCKTRGCRGTWEVPARPISSVVGSPYVGTWRKAL